MRIAPKTTEVPLGDGMKGFRIAREDIEASLLVGVALGAFLYAGDLLLRSLSAFQRESMQGSGPNIFALFAASLVIAFALRIMYVRRQPKNLGEAYWVGILGILIPLGFIVARYFAGDAYSVAKIVVVVIGSLGTGLLMYRLTKPHYAKPTSSTS